MRKQLVIIPSWKYNDRVIEFIKESYAGYTKICYITLNKTYKAILDLFNENGIENEKFYFIDFITPSVLKTKPSQNCFFMDSCEDINKFADSFLNILKLKKINFVIFDSVSSFLVYNHDQQVIKFFNYVNSFLEKMNVELAILALEEDAQKPTIKQLKMSVNNTKVFWE